MSEFRSTDSCDAVHPLPDTSPFCRVIPGFLSHDECRALIAEAEARGFRSADSDYPSSYRSNDRQVLDDSDLAQRLMPRLRDVVPATWRCPEASDAPWTLDSINARFRLCRYTSGQAFGLHQDGVHHRSASCRSELTFMVYLTDAEEFESGDTVFYDGGPGADPQEIGRVRPRAGSLIVFDHRLWHAGEVVSAGIKHVLRSDILYRRELVASEAASAFESAHRGYVWALEPLDRDTFASGGRDTEIHLWKRDGRRGATLSGHRRSVLGLAALPHDRLASVSRDRSLRLWNTQSGVCVQAVEQAHDATILSVIALADGSLATSGADGVVKLWTADGEPRGVLGKADAWAWSLTRLTDKVLACAFEDGAIRLWDVVSGRLLEALKGDTPLRTLAASADGQWLISGDINGRATSWNRSNGSWKVHRVQQAHTAAVRRVRLLAQDQLASVGEDGAVCLSTLGAGPHQMLGLHTNFATDVVAVGGDFFSCGYDGQIRKLPNRSKQETTE